MREPRTEIAKRLLREAYRHDPSCFVHQGMDCGRCSLPDRLRDIEDEAMAPFVEFASYVEGQTKPISYSMSGDTGGHRASEPRSKAMWTRANNLLNNLDAPGEEGLCVCGIGVLGHSSEAIRYCHFGYHTSECIGKKTK